MIKILILLLFTSLTSCTLRYTPVENSNFDKVDFSKIRSYQEGRSCKVFLLGIIPLPGDQKSLINAVKNGKISFVKVIDYENKLMLIPPVYKKCIIAYGTR